MRTGKKAAKVHFQTVDEKEASEDKVASVLRWDAEESQEHAALLMIVDHRE